MKKLLTVVPLLLVVLLFFSSCKDAHVPLSKLAYTAASSDTSFNQSELEALRKYSIQDSLDLAYYLAHDGDTLKKGSYVPGHGAAEPTFASAFPVNNTLAAVAARGTMATVCPCPGSTGSCPCPDASSVLLTTRAQNVEVYDNDVRLEEEPLEGKVDAGWKSYRLKDLNDRDFVLTIQADFAGIGRRTYKLNMKIEKGELKINQ